MRILVSDFSHEASWRISQLVARLLGLSSKPLTNTFGIDRTSFNDRPHLDHSGQAAFSFQKLVSRRSLHQPHKGGFRQHCGRWRCWSLLHDTCLSFIKADRILKAAYIRILQPVMPQYWDAAISMRLHGLAMAQYMNERLTCY